jgi:hypothetical protein
MSEPAPAGARCATHPDLDARWACRRCGAFFCVDCERRTRPEALPMCPSCWDLRSKVVTTSPAKPSTAIFTSALVLGVVSLVPAPVLMIISLVVNVIALTRAKDGMRPQRWKPITGLVLTVGSMAVWLAVFVLAAIHGA